MIVSTNIGGLSNRIKSMVSCIRYSKENNVEVKVYWKVLDSYKKNYHVLNCSFSKLFSNNIEINKDYSKYSCIIYKFPNLMIFDEDKLPDNFDTYDKKNAKYTPNDKRRRNIDHNYNKIPRNVIENYLPCFKLLKPIKELQEKIDHFSKKFNERTISIHIRSWSRKNEESRHYKQFQNGIHRFETEMLKYKTHNFFLTTDSQKVKHYFQNKSILKEKIICYPRKTNLDTSRIYPEGIQEDLIELYLLSKNKIIIGSHNSTYTEVAWWLAECPENITIL